MRAIPRIWVLGSHSIQHGTGKKNHIMVVFKLQKIPVYPNLKKNEFKATEYFIHRQKKFKKIEGNENFIQTLIFKPVCFYLLFSVDNLTSVI